MHYNTVTYVALGVAVILSIGGVVSTQDLHVLWDNENSSDYDNNWRYLMDTLRAHGVIVHYVEDTSYFHSEEGVGEGWTNLMAMDMLCLIDLCYYYDAEEKGRIINFARSGGRIVELESSSRFHPYANDLLINSGWRTTMEILDTVNRLLWSDEEAYELTPFPPVTNGFGICKLFRPTAMYCGEHAWPYYIIHGSIPYPVAAISYPFLHEGNCSTYILLVTGVENWNENRRYADE